MDINASENKSNDEKQIRDAEVEADGLKDAEDDLGENESKEAKKKHTLEVYREAHRHEIDMRKEYILATQFHRTTYLYRRKKRQNLIQLIAPPKKQVLCIPSISVPVSSDESIRASSESAF